MHVHMLNLTAFLAPTYDQELNFYILELLFRDLHIYKTSQ